MTRPEVPEMETLRRAMAANDETADVNTLADVIDAARAVLMLYDEQIAKYDAAMSTSAVHSMLAWAQQVRDVMQAASPAPPVCGRHHRKYPYSHVCNDCGEYLGP